MFCFFFGSGRVFYGVRGTISGNTCGLALLKVWLFARQGSVSRAQVATATGSPLEVFRKWRCCCVPGNFYSSGFSSLQWQPRRGESNSHDKVDEGQLFHYEKRRVVNNFTTNCDLIILAM